MNQALLNVCFWAAVLPAIMDPKNALAVQSRSGGILNQNLYFFSWAASAASFLVFFSFRAHIRCVSSSSSSSSDASNGPCTTGTWAGLVATSIVVMVSAARQFENWHCDDNTAGTVNGLVGFDVVDRDAACDRVEFGISLGATSTVLALVWLIASYFVKGRLGSRLETILAWFLLVSWTCGVAYLTFDQSKAPAQVLGNLYFFTWGSWALVVVMTIASVQEMMSPNESPTPEESKPDENDATNDEPAIVEVEEDIEAIPTDE